MSNSIIFVKAYNYNYVIVIIDSAGMSLISLLFAGAKLTKILYKFSWIIICLYIKDYPLNRCFFCGITGNDF